MNLAEWRLEHGLCPWCGQNLVTEYEDGALWCVVCGKVVKARFSAFDSRS